MEATILSPDFKSIAVIDTYKSFIWNDRYDEAGDFELYLPITNMLPDSIKKGYYLWSSGSDRLMIIESIGYESDEETGAYFTVSGRSLESILERRIIWNKKIFSAEYDDSGKLIEGTEPNLQNGIKTLLMENVIDPAIKARKIPNFIFEESTDEKVTSLTFEAQYLGEDLYKVVTTLCRENEIGFSITLNDENQFVFKLYAGIDRSYGTDEKPQLANPYVVFSKNNDNLINTNYIDSDEKLKNVALIVGETELDEDGNEISRLDYELGDITGIERRETFVDATSLSLEDELGGIMTADRYRAHLKQRGIDALIDNTPVAAFSAEVEPNVMYVYGEDYFVGDIVQIVDKYGTEARAYISEYIRSCDESGIAAYPTFKIIQKGAYEE
jgi:predicted nucleic-acid-binding protein